MVILNRFHMIGSRAACRFRSQEQRNSRRKIFFAPASARLFSGVGWRDAGAGQSTGFEPHSTKREREVERGLSDLLVQQEVRDANRAARMRRGAGTRRGRLLDSTTDLSNDVYARDA